MRKFICFLILLICIFSIASCGKEETNIYEDNIFELRNVLYDGESENYEVQIFQGKREKDYAFDGKAGELTPFFLVKITPKIEISDSIKIEFTIDKKYSATIEKNTDTDNFSWDFQKNMDSKPTIIVKIDNGITLEEVTTLNITKSLTQSWKSALLTATGKYETEMGEEEIRRNRDMGFEVALRLVKDNAQDKIYWHCIIFTIEGKIWGTLINAA